MLDTYEQLTLRVSPLRDLEAHSSRSTGMDSYPGDQFARETILHRATFGADIPGDEQKQLLVSATSVDTVMPGSSIPDYEREWEGYRHKIRCSEECPDDVVNYLERGGRIDIYTNVSLEIRGRLDEQRIRLIAGLAVDLMLKINELKD